MHESPCIYANHSLPICMKFHTYMQIISYLHANNYIPTCKHFPTYLHYFETQISLVILPLF